MVKKQNTTQSTQNDSKKFPPVVAVLGHVDHGKTSLLDAIRKTNIAQREHGGITQKIGASTIEVMHDGEKRLITFIDTPGHEAFSQMRSRGTQAADIGLLIVSLVDGVMPQTQESIQLLKESKIPFIVVLTKADVPDTIPEKVKQQLLKEQVMIEGYGGDIPIIEVSAKAGTHIKELLELILLSYEIHYFDSNSSSEQSKQVQARSVDGPLQAIIIESKLDQRTGPQASLIIKNGTIWVGDELICDDVPAKVRTLLTDTGEHVKRASVGAGVALLGFEKAPKVGSIVVRKKDTQAQPASVTSSDQPASASQNPQTPMGSAPVFLFEKEKGSLSIILVADTLGSLEAIRYSIPESAYIVSEKTGEVSEADILMAKSTNAFVIGFNTKIRPEVARLADVEKVLFKNYTIIYELIGEIQDVLEGKRLALIEKIFGKAKILASFPFEKAKVLGIKVLEGRIAKGDKVRLERNDQVVGESTISSVRQGKNTVSKIEKGQEGGILILPSIDFTIGDMILSHG